MNKERIIYLLQQFKLHRLTTSEEQELHHLFNNELEAQTIREILEEKMETLSMPEGEDLQAPKWQMMAEQILATDRLGLNDTHSISPAKNYGRIFVRVAAAAAVLTGIGIGIYFWSQPADTIPPAIVSAKNTPATIIHPGHHGAVLTLDDNSEVLLDSAGNGMIAEQKGARVLLKNGELLYDGKAGSAVAYNRMSTPKGRLFQLLLSDGTRVWLNASSSIRYPTVFKGKERKVEITGEVYFEVARQANQPFLVSLHNGTIVEVLGTRFNINAYEDEATIRTTLLEGSVRLSSGNNKPLVLDPGQQAGIGHTASAKNFHVTRADLNKVMAWKNGVFNFEGAGLAEVMRQLSRWYDVEVIYENGIVPDIKFGGKMSRNIQFADMLKALEMSKVHFRLNERQLIILP